MSRPPSGKTREDSNGQVSGRQLRDSRRGSGGETQAPARPRSLARMEWDYIHEVLEGQAGNISRTARILGLPRRSLQRKLQRYPPLN